MLGAALKERIEEVLRLTGEPRLCPGIDAGLQWNP